jgi:hypothetical protein
MGDDKNEMVGRYLMNYVRPNNTDKTFYNPTTLVIRWVINLFFLIVIIYLPIYLSGRVQISDTETSLSEKYEKKSDTETFGPSQLSSIPLNLK